VFRIKKSEYELHDSELSHFTMYTYLIPGWMVSSH